MIQIKDFNGKVLKEIEGDTLIGAYLRRADLRGADFHGANLFEANFCGANLFEANFYEANLRGANLYETNLRRVDFRGANLYRADLRGANLCESILDEADLRESDLRGVNFDGVNLRRADISNAIMPIYSKWSFGIVNNKIKIGCECKTIEQWDEWFKGDDEFETKRGTEEFIRIEAMYKAYKAYFLHLENAIKNK